VRGEGREEGEAINDITIANNGPIVGAHLIGCSQSEILACCA
jgi:hypothetical protein